MKILVIDDHALFREGIEALLVRLDAATDVLHAANFAAGFEIAQTENELDVILLDLALPDSSGMQGLMQLRESVPEVPVVVVSATDTRDAVIDALDCGAMGFIPKSSSGQLLLQALRLVLAKGVYIPPTLLSRSNDPSAYSGSNELTPAAAPTKAELGLTVRQTEVLACLVQGLPNKLIARSLGMEVSTVKSHVTEVLRALDATSRTQAVLAAARLGLTFASQQPPPPK